MGPVTGNIGGNGVVMSEVHQDPVLNAILASQG